MWRTRLAKVAQVAGQAGSAMLLAAPLAAIVGRRPVPAVLIGASAFAILGTGVIAQLAALPTELDASFGRALPILRNGYIDEEEEKSARQILTACSLTYVASSLAGVLTIWRWIPTGPAGRAGAAAQKIPVPRL